MNNGNKRQTNSKYSDLVRQIEVKNDKGQVIGTREVVFYPELLNAAHDEKLAGIDTQLVQFPNSSNGNTAIFTAKVKLGERVFTGTGDANPDNVSPEIVKHFIQAAETRAKARALRDALNVPILAVEELGHELVNRTVLFGPIQSQNGKKAPEKKPNGRKTKVKEPPKDESGGASATVTPGKPLPTVPVNNQSQKVYESKKEPQPPMDPMTERQRKYMFHLLADQGLYGDDAHEHLKKVFKLSLSKRSQNLKPRNT